MWVRFYAILALILASATLGALPVDSGRAWTPYDAYLLSAEDARQFPPSPVEYRRYLWNPDETAETLLAVETQIPHLSLRPDIFRVTPLHGGVLIRMDIKALGLEPYVYGSLATVDPFFHQKILVGDKATYAVPTWIVDLPQAATAAAYLIEHCQTQAPVLRADWFIWQTAQQQDRDPAGYYDFLQVKDQKDFEELIGFNEKALEKFPIEWAETVVNSTVRRRKGPRAVVGLGKIYGWYLVTLDPERPLGKANPIRVMDPRRNLEFTASETLGNKSNGFLATGLFNNKGVRQSVAPQTVVFDHTGEWNNDYNIYAGSYSCFNCHDKVGINTIKGYVRGTLNRPPLQLNAFYDVKDEEGSLRRQRIYSWDMAEALEDTRRIYGRALTRATGADPQKALAALANVFRRFDGPVSIDRAARLWGTTPQQLQASLHRQLEGARLAGNPDAIDPVLATYVSAAWMKAGNGWRAVAPLAAEPPEPVMVDVFLEAYPLGAYALRGVRPLQYQRAKP